ncbi:hypothetical protein ACFLU6_02690 [Acidobacteriota bacterium]
MKRNRVWKRCLAAMTVVTFLAYSVAISADPGALVVPDAPDFEVEVVDSSIEQGRLTTVLVYFGNSEDRYVYATIEIERDSAKIAYEAEGEVLEVSWTGYRDIQPVKVYYQGFEALLDPYDLDSPVQSRSYSTLRKAFLKGDLSRRLAHLASFQASDAVEMHALPDTTEGITEWISGDHAGAGTDREHVVVPVTGGDGFRAGGVLPPSPDQFDMRCLLSIIALCDAVAAVILTCGTPVASWGCVIAIVGMQLAKLAVVVDCLG